LYGGYQIPAIPSPKNPWGDRLDGLKLAFDKDGWQARLYSDSGADNCPELFIPQVWEAESFDGLFQTKDNWGELLEDVPELDNRDELAKLLIRDDPRWRLLIPRTDTNLSRIPTVR
jgi:hypothetical protein